MAKNKEIERKFIIQNHPDLSQMDYMDIVQGYNDKIISENYIYRLRQVIYFDKDGKFLNEKFYQTIKGAGSKEREEFEIELSRDNFHILWPLCSKIFLHKRRHVIVCDDVRYKAHLDIYKNELHCLKTAEVEFDTIEECEAYIPEEWFGKEVTEDKRYSNYDLAKNIDEFC